VVAKDAPRPVGRLVGRLEIGQSIGEVGHPDQRASSRKVLGRNVSESEGSVGGDVGWCEGGVERWRVWEDGCRLGGIVVVHGRNELEQESRSSKAVLVHVHMSSIS